MWCATGSPAPIELMTLMTVNLKPMTKMIVFSRSPAPIELMTLMPARCAAAMSIFLGAMLSAGRQ